MRNITLTIDFCFKMVNNESGFYMKIRKIGSDYAEDGYQNEAIGCTTNGKTLHE